MQSILTVAWLPTGSQGDPETPRVGRPSTCSINLNLFAKVHMRNFCFCIPEMLRCACPSVCVSRGVCVCALRDSQWVSNIYEWHATATSSGWTLATSEANNVSKISFSFFFLLLFFMPQCNTCAKSDTRFVWLDSPVEYYVYVSSIYLYIYFLNTFLLNCWDTSSASV